MLSAQRFPHYPFASHGPVLQALVEEVENWRSRVNAILIESNFSHLSAAADSSSLLHLHAALKAPSGRGAAVSPVAVEEDGAAPPVDTVASAAAVAALKLRALIKEGEALPVVLEDLPLLHVEADAREWCGRVAEAFACKVG